MLRPCPGAGNEGLLCYVAYSKVNKRGRLCSSACVATLKASGSLPRFLGMLQSYRGICDSSFACGVPLTSTDQGTGTDSAQDGSSGPGERSDSLGTEGGKMFTGTTGIWTDMLSLVLEKVQQT